LRTIDTSVTKKRNLKYFAYDLANFEEFVKNPSIINDISLDKGDKSENITYYEVIKKLKKL
jgi:NAD-dependent DNA ligase